MASSEVPAKANRPGSSVSVVVVSFNTAAQLRRCLTAIEPEHETIVVDNASSDGSVDMVRREFPHVNVIANSKNRGFGAANNQGIDVATRPYILLLNSDAYAEPGAISALSDEMADASTIAVGGRLLNLDGTIQDSAANKLTLWAVLCEQLYLEKMFPRSRVFNPYWRTPRGEAVTDTVQAMGACFMLKPVERFDERYFLYCEDTDLCARLSAHGRIRYVPQARFLHELGSSSSARRWLAVARYNRGKELYFSIHEGRGSAAACWVLNRIGASARMLVWALLAVVKGRRGLDQARLFAKVTFAPLRGYPPDS